MPGESYKLQYNITLQSPDSLYSTDPEILTHQNAPIAFTFPVRGNDSLLFVKDLCIYTCSLEVLQSYDSLFGCREFIGTSTDSNRN